MLVAETQSQQTKTKINEDGSPEVRGIATCLMSDGPSCASFDKYLAHSVAIFNNVPEPKQPRPNDFERLWLKARSHGSQELTNLMKMSSDNGSFELGIQVVQTHYTFIMTHYSYDKLTIDNDYQIAKSFGKVYSPTVELIIDFPEPVMLSQKKPPHEINLAYSKQMEKDLFYYPLDTYAYTVNTPYIMHFDRQVAIESFWIRLHRSQKAYIQRAEGTRTVQVLQHGEVVAESTFLVPSDEWILIRPAEGQDTIIGDTLKVDAKTDIDSIVVSWGDQVRHWYHMKELGFNLSLKKHKTFKSWKVDKQNDSDEYSIKIAPLQIAPQQKLDEDRIMLDKEQRKIEDARRK